MQGAGAGYDPEEETLLITEQDTAFAEDAVHATARIGIVDVKHGELAVPKRVLGHLLDGNVTVQLLRGGTETARCTAELVTNSEHTFGKLIGIAWPDDVTAGTRVTVMCAKGSAGHDVAVLLPPLEPTVTFLGPVPDEDDETPTSLADTDALVALLADQLAADPPVETVLPGPADYEVPTTLRRVERDEQLTETIDAVPAWPAGEVEKGDGFAAEQADVWDGIDAQAEVETTTIIPAAGTLPPLKVAWSAFRRRLTPGRAVLLTAVVAVVVTWAAAWAVMGR